MRVLGLRHGQSEYNLLGLCNDDPARQVALTELGRHQAATALQSLRTEPVQAIYHSTLTRAVQTAAIIAEGLGMVAEIEPRLNDIRSGCDGQPVADYLAAIATDPLDTRVGAGETLREYQQRVNGFLNELTSRDVQCVLLIAHEETLRMLKARAEGLALAAVVGLPFGNCEVYPFEL